MGLTPSPSLRTPLTATPVCTDDRTIPIGLRDEYVAVGAHIAHFWETPGEFRDAVRFLQVGLDRGEACVIFGHTEGNRRVCESLAERGYCAYLVGQGELVIVRAGPQDRASHMASLAKRHRVFLRERSYGRAPGPTIWRSIGSDGTMA